MRFAGVRGLMDRFSGMVDQCLSEYDLDGWTDGTWAWEPEPPPADR